MNPTKAAPGSVFSSTFEVLNNKKKNTITGAPQWLNPHCFPWGEAVGKLHQTSKTKHRYKNSKKTKAALRGQVHSSKIKRKKFKSTSDSFSASPKSPKWGQESLALVALHTQGTAQELGPGSELWRTPSPRAGSGRKAAKDGK